MLLHGRMMGPMLNLLILFLMNRRGGGAGGGPFIIILLRYIVAIAVGLSVLNLIKIICSSS